MHFYTLSQANSGLNFQPFNKPNKGLSNPFTWLQQSWEP